MRAFTPFMLAAGLAAAAAAAAPAFADMGIDDVEQGLPGRAIITTTLDGSGKATSTTEVDNLSTLQACFALAYSAALSGGNSTAVCFGKMPMPINSIMGTINEEIQAIYSCRSQNGQPPSCKEEYTP